MYVRNFLTVKRMIQEGLTEEELLKTEAETVAGEEEKETCQNCNLTEHMGKERKDSDGWKEKKEGFLKSWRNSGRKR